MDERSLTMCADLIGAAYAMSGQAMAWRNDALRDLYRDELVTYADGIGAFNLLRDWITECNRHPKVSELRSILSPLRPVAARNDADTYRRPPEAREVEPGEALRLMREGFMARHEKEHPGEPIDPGMERLMQKLARVRAAEAEQWRKSRPQAFNNPNIVLDTPRQESRPSPIAEVLPKVTSRPPVRRNLPVPAAPDLDSWFDGVE